MVVWFYLHFEKEHAKNMQKTRKNLKQMHVFCMFPFKMQIKSYKHAKNMHFFAAFSLFLWIQPRIQNACFLHVPFQNACQSSSISEISTFLAGKVWKTLKHECFLHVSMILLAFWRGTCKKHAFLNSRLELQKEGKTSKKWMFFACLYDFTCISKGKMQTPRISRFFLVFVGPCFVSYNKMYII